MSKFRHFLLLTVCATCVAAAAAASAGERKKAREGEPPRREEQRSPRSDRDEGRPEVARRLAKPRPNEDRRSEERRNQMTPAAAPWREIDRDQGDFQRCGAMPYSSMRNGVEAQFQGRIVGQQFLPQQCQYRLKVLRPSGQVLAVSVDAQSGSVLGVSGDE